MANDEVGQTIRRQLGLVILAWLPVTIPLLWGIWQTVKKPAVLFS